jgi:Serine dehydrogenase proteinase
MDMSPERDQSAKRKAQPTLVERRDESVSKSANHPSVKTPMFEAMNASRYQRQDLIKEIHDIHGTRLLCYICGPGTSIDRDDTVFLIDLLHHVPRGEDLDILLHTGGGDIDAAEKLITIIRNWVDQGLLRVIVPDFAKSAGTLIALGADWIVMSDTSELGPIDPQLEVSDANGNRVIHSVQNYLDAYETHSSALRNNPSDPVARIMLEKLDPGTLKLFEAFRDRSRRFAEDQLKYGMFRSRSGPQPAEKASIRGNGNYTAIAADLIDTKRWLSHGQMIGASTARDIGLSVEHVPPTEESWQRYWRLYCLQRLSLNDGGKLFESEHVCLPVGN